MINTSELSVEPDQLHMDPAHKEAIALHRFGVIAEAVNDRLSPAERGVLVRHIAGRSHAHPDGTECRYSRGTIDRWVRAWRAKGLEGLVPQDRADTGTVRAHPELIEEACALRLELPTRSAAQIARILWHRHAVRVAERTVREQLRRRGLSREALSAEPKSFGRYEAARPNERWVTDVLVGPYVPHPRVDTSVRAKLFVIVDDHSRLLVDGAIYAQENAPSCTPSPTRLKGGASRSASTASSASRSWPRPSIRGSPRWRS